MDLEEKKEKALSNVKTEARTLESDDLGPSLALLYTSREAFRQYT